MTPEQIELIHKIFERDLNIEGDEVVYLNHAKFAKLIEAVTAPINAEIANLAKENATLKSYDVDAGSRLIGLCEIVGIDRAALPDHLIDVDKCRFSIFGMLRRKLEEINLTALQNDAH